MMEGITVSFAADNPPLSVIAAAKIAGVSLTVDPSLPSGAGCTFYFSSGFKVSNADAFLRYLGRVAQISNFYGQDPIESIQIDEWIEYAHVFSKGSEFEDACSYASKYLSMRTFLVGYSLSVADIAIWTSLAGIGQRWESLRKSKKYQNNTRT
ncbi:Glutamate--tRNA ligase, cytoplasmic [Thalictrum thalictroides]|uniref:Glutamate--tRNA ligase, cytoplasmic n=1 Tax=Thalictrum thalictroides TaxID=46969 RepID=A0A7J6X3Z8_THATH|nr:Glutamate--tRNA ligase, cytoplasmic [Thalictrum thalictroides]